MIERQLHIANNSDTTTIDVRFATTSVICAFTMNNPTAVANVANTIYMITACHLGMSFLSKQSIFGIASADRLIGHEIIAPTTKNVITLRTER